MECANRCKMKLYYLNHKVGATEWNNTDIAVCDTAKGLYEELKKWATGEPFAPQGFSHMLIHYPNYQDKFFKKENLSQCLENNSVIFFMSSVGVPFQPFCHDYICGEAKDVRRGYIFGIKEDGRKVEETEWISLFIWAKALSEKLQNEAMTVEGIVNEMPVAIKRLLCLSHLDDTHSLRSQILTPFVALHLTLQDSFDEKKKTLIFDPECEKCCGDIRGLDKTLKDFLENVKNAPEKQKTDIKGKYDILKGKIDGLCEAIANNKTTELAMYIDLIGDFADMLDNAVRDIEAGNTY